MASRNAAYVFNRVIARENLAAIFTDRISKSPARGRDGVTPELVSDNLAEITARLSEKLATGNLIFTQYREVLQSKGAGKTPRVISVPTVRDRIALRAMAELLTSVFPYTRNTIPQVKVNQVFEALKTKKYDAFVKLDVKEFYPSIPHEQILARLRTKIRKSSILELFLQAIQTPTVPDRASKRGLLTLGIPQGLAISNSLSELVVEPIDRAIGQNANCAYFRYVDDVLILCNSADAEKLIHEAKELFFSVGLEAHDISSSGGKSSYGLLREEFQYLGYLFKDGKISVRTESVHRLESSIARAFTRYKKKRVADHHSHELARCQWRVNLAITGCVYKNQARGWLHYFRQLDDLTLLKKLDISVERFEQRFRVPSAFKSKSFLRAYWEIRGGRYGGNHSSYIPNYDSMTADEMRSFMMSIGVVVANNLNEFEVQRLFHGVVGRQINELEVDVGDFY